MYLFTTEFGHNWGSQHDPDTSECAPSSFDGGKYMMYTYSVSGYEKNNDVSQQSFWGLKIYIICVSNYATTASNLQRFL